MGGRAARDGDDNGDSTRAPECPDAIASGMVLLSPRTFHTLHLLGDASAALRRISELLRPGGLLVSVSPAGEAGRILRVLGSFVLRVGLLSHLTAFRVSDVQVLLRDGGFEVLESEVFEGAIPTWFAVARTSRRLHH